MRGTRAKLYNSRFATSPLLWRGRGRLNLKDMKYYILIFISFLFVGNNLSAQETTARQRMEQRRESQSDAKESDNSLSIRAKQKNREQTATTENIVWKREIYRFIDLSKEQNAALYYPAQSVDGQMNLFATLFNLLADKKIAAYEYLDGQEVFNDNYKIDFVDVLDRFNIPYRPENGKIAVDETDIPSSEVQGYYIKECYYFDGVSATYGVKTIAICPILCRQDDYDAETIRYPLFWIPYNEIHPYAMRMPVMTSALNNAMNGTVDDFFRKRLYNGEIYKAANPRNLAIAQYTATPEEIKKEQDRIEKELADFERNLWENPHDFVLPQPKVKKRREKTESSSNNASVSVRGMREMVK